ncbi:MAG: hypothetical protein ACFB9M_19260 [Myxococcota bacterium]
MRRRLALGLAGLVASWATDARAESGVTLGIDIGIHRVDDNFDIDGSWGPAFASRVGYQFDFRVVRVIPELQIGYGARGLPELFQGVGGVRVSFLDWRLMPVAFAHVGGVAGDLSGLAWDAGGGLDVALGAVTAGLFLAYNRIEEQDLDFAARPDDAAAWQSVQLGAMFTVAL